MIRYFFPGLDEATLSVIGDVGATLILIACIAIPVIYVLRMIFRPDPKPSKCPIENVKVSILDVGKDAIGEWRKARDAALPQEWAQIDREFSERVRQYNQRKQASWREGAKIRRGIEVPNWPKRNVPVKTKTKTR